MLHTLGDIVGDNNSGLASQRQDRLVLNYVNDSRTREAIARMLGAQRSVLPVWFEKTGELLKRHQESTASCLASGNRLVLLNTHTTRAIHSLAENCRAYGQAFTESEIRTLLQILYCAPQVEFHPTDACNQKCKGCTYEHDDTAKRPPPVRFPFDRLRSIATLEPKAVTVVGGGEPTIYKDKGHDFVDLIEQLRDLLPDSRFGLISNGTILPRESTSWARQFQWIRFSVDAANEQTYSALRGTDDFHSVTVNLVRLLKESPVSSIGVSFVFSRANIREAPAAAHFFYELIRKECPTTLERLNIAYRPLRRDIQHAERQDFPEAITRADIKNVEAEFLRMASKDHHFETFLRRQTNCSEISLGNSHEPVEFHGCGYSMIYRLVRASGEVRPCCMRIAEPEFYLGNVLNDAAETISLNALYNAAYLRPGCDALGCRLCKVNHLIEENATARVLPDPLAH